MKAFIITLVACLAWLQPVIAQNDADQVWTKFKNNTNNMYIFLDGITNTNSPKSFTPYIEEFVDICLKRGVEWNALYEEFKETVLPKDIDIAICYAVCLCKHTTDYSKIIEVLSLLPTTHEYNAKDIKDAVIYPDGKIAFAINLEGMKYGKTIGDLVKASTGPNFYSQYERENQTFLYQPTGNSMLGLFKIKGTNDFYNVNTAKISDKPDLYIGFTLNKQGEKISEKYEQYDSFAKMEQKRIKDQEIAYIAEKKKQNAINAAGEKKEKALENRLVAKYGRKAYNAMNNLKPYIGMPEGIIREFYFCDPDDKGVYCWYPYAYTGTTRSGVNIYKGTKQMNAILFTNGNVVAQIFAQNGRVISFKNFW